MNLLIVESPSKAKTIEKYLGAGWRVIASVGHVRDLVPENGSVDTNNNFAMKWQIMPGKEKQIKLITDELKKADAVYLASDPDREGEAIAWHLLDILKNKNHKSVFTINELLYCIESIKSINGRAFNLQINTTDGMYIPCCDTEAYFVDIVVVVVLWDVATAHKVDDRVDGEPYEQAYNE